MRCYISSVSVTVVLVAAVVFQGVRSGESEGEDDDDDCLCRPATRNRPATCAGVATTATTVTGCTGTNKYLQCNGSTCSTKTCTTGMVWNPQQNNCAACPIGMEIITNRRNVQSCGCKAGTEWDSVNLTCRQCATGATSVAGGECSCAVGYQVYPATNACTLCPTGITLYKEEKCRCQDPSTLFQTSTWTCVKCPGPVTSGKCQCADAQQVLDKQSVSCFSCPPETYKRGNECECNAAGAEFYMSTKSCRCPPGKQLDSTLTRCILLAPVAPTIAPVTNATSVPTAPPSGQGKGQP